MSKQLWISLFGLVLLAGCYFFYALSKKETKLHAGPLPKPARPAKVGPSSSGKKRTGLSHRLPTAIIIGVKKGGTRALLEMLQMHPRITGAHNEVHFFDREENYELGLAWYRNQMPLSEPRQVVMEKSPAYFVTPGVPERIRKVNPRMRLILLLRNPVSRSVSDFMQGMHKKRGSPVKVSELTAEELKQLQIRFQNRVMKKGNVNSVSGSVSIGIYHTHLERWLKVFPRSQIYVACSESLVRNPVPILKEIEKFLGVDKPKRFPWGKRVVKSRKAKFFCLWKEKSVGEEQGKLFKKCLEDSKGREHIPIPPIVEKKLYTFFAPHNKKLFEMLGKTFNWTQPRHR